MGDQTETLKRHAALLEQISDEVKGGLHQEWSRAAAAFQLREIAQHLRTLAGGQRD